MKNLIKNFLIYGLGTAIGKFISFFLLPIYTAYFSPEDYGNLELILTCTSIVGAFGMLQIETAFQRFYYDYESDEKKSLCTTALVSTLFFSVIFVAVGICLSPFIVHWLEIEGMAILLMLSFLTVIPTNVVIIIFVIFRFSDKPQIFTILNITNILLSILLTLLFVIVFDLGIRGVIYATFIASIIVVLISFYLCRYSFSKKWSIKQAAKMLSFALPQFPARIGSLSNSYINRFFIVGKFSVYTLGLFSFGLKIASLMLMIQSAMQLAWLPYMYKIIKTEDDHKNRIRETVNRLIRAILVLCVLISLFSKELVLLLSNVDYLGAYKVVGTISLSYALYIFKDLVDIGVNIKNKTAYTSYIYFIATSLNILFIYLVPNSWGILGISIAMVASNLILFALTLFFSEKLYRISYPVSPFLFIIVAIAITILLAIIDINVIFRVIFAVSLIVIWGVGERKSICVIYNKVVTRKLSCRN